MVVEHILEERDVGLEMERQEDKQEGGALESVAVFIERFTQRVLRAC